MKINGMFREEKIAKALNQQKSSRIKEKFEKTK